MEVAAGADAKRRDPLLLGIVQISSGELIEAKSKSTSIAMQLFLV